MAKAESQPHVSYKLVSYKKKSVLPEICFLKQKQPGILNKVYTIKNLTCQRIITIGRPTSSLIVVPTLHLALLYCSHDAVLIKS